MVLVLIRGLTILSGCVRYSNAVVMRNLRTMRIKICFSVYSTVVARGGNWGGGGGGGGREISLLF